MAQFNNFKSNGQLRATNIFMAKDNSIKHVKLVPTDNLRSKPRCDVCGRMFTRKTSLEEHMNSKHDGAKYPCDQCNRVFSYKRGFVDHKKKVHEEKRIPCIKCNFVAKTQQLLESHYSRSHPKEPNFYCCNQCSKLFKSLANLDTHLKTVHKQ